MIKAEVISHEGNPGPNWLDRCRSVATPVNVTVVALLLIGGALFIGISKKEQANTANRLPATSNSQQSDRSGASSLQVQPLDQITTSSEGTPNVQSASGGTAPTTNSPASGNTAAPISAPQTPSFNNYRPRGTAPQTPLTEKDITNKVQSTLQGVQNNVNRTLTGITNGLGL
jgi:hypothetical protein